MRAGRGTRGALALIGCAAVVWAAAAPAASAQGGDLGATIRRDAHGTPHILAGDFAGIGYGYGYAFAQDNVCVMADSYVTVRGERSRFFGPDKSWNFRGNGTTAGNLNSDFFFQRIIDTRVVEKLLDQQGANALRPEVRELVRGYTAGYNQYLRDTGVDNIPDPECRGKPWVRPIEEIDAYRRFHELALLASAGVAIDGIGGAQPLNGAAPFDFGNLPTNFIVDALEGGSGQRGLREGLLGIGSNAYALGSDATDNRRGMLLGNPHFPWDGAERFYQAHFTIPGRFNVSGATLFGAPIVVIGTTQKLAWSHTVSTAYRFTPFQETLVPGSPTSYIVDGQVKQMKRDEVTVQALKPDGTLEPRTRTLYSTDHGPMMTSILGLPVFPWTPTTAFSMGDANAQSFRLLNHFFESDLAQSVPEYDRVLRRNQGVPWVNSLAADSSGRAYYADISVVPNVSNAKAQQCNTAVGAATYAALRLPVLDGSRSQCNWDNDPDAVQPGTFGPSHMPSLQRRDFVENSNDSYWLSNPQQPLTGFARIIGDEGTARALRTRIGIRMAQQRLDGSDGRPGRRFTLRQLQDTVFNNRQYAGEMFRDDLVKMCRDHPTLPSTGGAPVNVSEACPILERWNLRDDLDSRGAVLFRRFATRALAAQGGPYRTPFSASDPVNTPRDLDTSNPQVQAALADAVKDLRDSGIPLDARLREWQYDKRGSERVPIHGGPGGLGVFNAINVGWVPGQGYPNVPHGSSFVQTVQLTGGCPDQRTILTYSESTDPTSPWFGDQTRMFSRKQWVDQPFCEREVAAADLTVTTIGSARKTIRLSVSPKRVRAGRRTTLRFRAITVHGAKRRSVRGAVIKFAGRRVKTDRKGRARITVALRASGMRRAKATLRGLRSGRVGVRVLRAR